MLQAWPTLGISWGEGAYPCYVWPNWQGRTGHIPSIHSYSAWCIYEGTEEKEAGWGQYLDRVDYAAWLRAARSGAWHVFGWPDDTSGLCFQPVVFPSLVTSSGGLLYLKRIAMRCQTPIHSWEECLDSSCSSTSAFVGWCARGLQQVGTQGFSFYIACAYSFWHSSTCRGRRQVIFYYKILALPESWRFSLMAVTWLTWSHRLAVVSGICLGDLFIHIHAMLRHTIRMNGSMVSY